MQNEWMIGNVIKKLRESQGMKQSQLCQGLCSVSTLCKFENGERELDYFLVSVLMQRLGYGLDKYEFYGSSDEWVQWEQMYTMNQFRQEKQMKKLRDALDAYREAWKENIEKSSIQKQFVTWLEGILEKWAGHYEKVEGLFQRAISYTVPDWEKVWREKNAVSVRELSILTELGDIYEQNGGREKAYGTWKSICDYIEANQRKTAEILPLYTSVVLRLSPCLLERSSYWEGISLCEKALKALAKRSRIDNWPRLLYWKGKFEEALLELDGVEEKEENAICHFFAAMMWRFWMRGKKLRKNKFRENLKKLTYC